MIPLGKTTAWRGDAAAVITMLVALAAFWFSPANIGGRQLRAADAAAASATNQVSFYKQLRPIFQSQCHGCHQPAKAKGGYVMTDFDRLFAPGDSKEQPVVAGNPDASLLIKQITPVNGEAEMPKGKPPLAAHELELVRRWVAEGAKNDTPANAQRHFDADHPPTYSRPPIVTSIDFSPDGALIAVAGFHEVLLHNADGSGIAARLIGASERIQSVRFSPDGTRLAVAAGLPARLGEIQIWNSQDRKLIHSVPVGFDTVYGVSWSPDGKLVAFGCPDKTVRAVDAETGRPVLQQGSHEDWVLDTVFTTNGAHIVSVGRDMTAKLTEVASQRFIDNITSITPGALRGGLQAIARHPAKDEVLVGGADGTPQIFQVFRQAARKIGDNATLLRRFPAMEGRIFSVDYSADGKLIAAGAGLDAHGSVHVYTAQFDSTIPTNILKTYEKTIGEYSKEEKDAIEKFVTAHVRLQAAAVFTNAAVYAVAFSPDGTRVAAAGSDGRLHLIDAADGKVSQSFDIAPQIATTSAGAAAAPQANTAAADPALVTLRPGSGLSPAAATSSGADAAAGTWPPERKLAALEVHPAAVHLASRADRIQLLVTAKLDSGDTFDVTRLATYTAPSEGFIHVDARGLVSARKSGNGSLTVSLAGQRLPVAVTVAPLPETFPADFVRDVAPILSRVGCNAGTCHGAKDGKNGYKLSLRGYDPVFDVRSLTDDLAGRRVNLASPDESLMLLKATAAVPHEGGQRLTLDSEYYAVLREWIRQGVRLSRDTPRVASITLLPRNPVVQTIGGQQQMRVVATYADGTERDVTAEAFIESNNTDIAAIDGSSVITSLRRGEAAILARYEGNYIATTLTVMGDRSGFVWQEPPTNNRIDEFVAAKWKRMKILPSDLCTDAEFARRVALDLTGLPPSAEELRAFLANPRDTRSKRDALIERLLNGQEFVDHWANKWADLLQVNRKFLGEEGAQTFRDWIRREIESNTPYDQFVSKLLTATGSNRENPAAAYWKILRTPAEAMENTTHLFLATRFNCNKCHDHPFERWTQDQYYNLAQYFARVGLKKDDASGDKTIGGTAVEGAKPLYEIVADKSDGDVTHDRTGKVVAPAFPFPTVTTAATNDTRRAQLAAWITSADNRYFAMSYVNRLWGYLMGVGLVEPLDDIRAGNPPSNPDLLEHLTREFIESGFNTRHVLRLICQSRTYQLSLVTHRWNADDKVNFSHAMARRLPAEVLFDAVYRVTGSQPQFPGVKPGLRAAQLPDAAVDLPSGLLATLGRPPRESSCECERSNDIKLSSVLSLLSGPGVSAAINDPQNQIAALVKTQPDDRRLVEDIFLRVLNRPAKSSEVDAALTEMARLDQEHSDLTNQLAKAEASWTLTKPKLEQARLDAIAHAEKEFTDYLVAQAPKTAAAERARAEKQALVDQALKDYEPGLATSQAAWEHTLTSNDFATVWLPLEIKEAKSTGSARLERLANGVLRSTGSRGELTDYVLTTDLALTNITGLKLEALTDAELPGFGPGFKDGNFLLSELVVESAAKTNAAKVAKAKIADARADFIETGLELKHTFDGRGEQGRREGWSVGGAASQPHWAAFAFEKPLGEPDGTALKVTLQFRYQADMDIGRFRLWITTNSVAAAGGLPAEVAEALKLPAAGRNSTQAGRATAYYRGVDAGLRKREQEVILARKPLPEDAHLKELEKRLARATRPVPIDSALVQLRIDAELSARQVEQRRLTNAQDLTWALINTPAFLFNR
jgi:mono/diheme cytochrome c family protein